MPAGEVFVDIYADHGCSYAPSCLSCPFDVCRYDRGFAGNRVSRAVKRVTRDQEILAMRASGMQVEQIAKERGVSGRTVARVLSRSGPSRADEHIVEEHDSEARQVAENRRTGHRDLLLAMGVRRRTPWPAPDGAAALKPVRRIFGGV
jgi:hypothetical protein